jgi:DNA mismatch repair protein MutS
MTPIDAAGTTRDSRPRSQRGAVGSGAEVSGEAGRVIGFHSILFAGLQDSVDIGAPEPDEPSCFADLHLDQIVASVTAGREEYQLMPFFYRPLREVEAVRYRHQVLRDLERDDVLEAVRTFAGLMREMRKHLALAHKLHYSLQKERWFLEAVAVYCDAVKDLTKQLAAVELGSAGFAGLREYLADYAESDGFAVLAAETETLKGDLAGVRYAIHVKGSRVRVSRYEGEPDLSAEVEQTFSKFKQGAVKDYRIGFREHPEMNHVEAQILDLVARLHPDTFSTLEQYCARHRSYLDDTVGRFDREVQFYLAYLEHIDLVQSHGLEFCLPRVCTQSKEVHARAGFDLALASKLARQAEPVVCNDFHLTAPERVLVVTGPNQGGKTTFARMFGQLHYLASLGLPVPAQEARLFLADRLFTHFERDEDLRTLRGKFEDELVRIHEILQRATEDSILIMNESFGSTTLRDALLVGTEVVRQIVALDVLCLFVTFVDELASLSDATVSMMSTVVADDPAMRTYKIARKPADGLAFAAALAEKYGLTYESLRRRVTR